MRTCCKWRRRRKAEVKVTLAAIWAAHLAWGRRAGELGLNPARDLQAARAALSWEDPLARLRSIIKWQTRLGSATNRRTCRQWPRLKPQPQPLRSSQPSEQVNQISACLPVAACAKFAQPFALPAPAADTPAPLQPAAFNSIQSNPIQFN